MSAWMKWTYVRVAMARIAAKVKVRIVRGGLGRFREQSGHRQSQVLYNERCLLRGLKDVPASPTRGHPAFAPCTMLYRSIGQRADQHAHQRSIIYCQVTVAPEQTSTEPTQRDPMLQADQVQTSNLGVQPNPMHHDQRAAGGLRRAAEAGDGGVRDVASHGTSIVPFPISNQRAPLSCSQPNESCSTITHRSPRGTSSSSGRPGSSATTPYSRLATHSLLERSRREIWSAAGECHGDS